MLNRLFPNRQLFASAPWDFGLRALAARLLGLLGLCSVLALSPELRAQAPPNDDFTNRITLVGTNLAIGASNVDATGEPGEPMQWGRACGASVWWTWRAPAAGECEITTDGSSFDTVLAIYVGSTVTNLHLLAGNDDHGGLPTSQTYFQTTQNTDYQIVVDGINGDSGSITLSLSFTNAPPARPSNDNLSGRGVVSGSLVNASASNTLATRELGEPIHAGQYGDTSIWWTWTAPWDDTFKISTAGSDFDTTLGVYTGTSVSNLTLVASNDDEDPGVVLTSALTFDAVAGQTYQIAVDGFDGAAGHVSLAITPLTRLTHPQALPGGGFCFTLVGQTGQTNEIDASTNLLTWTPLGTVVNTNGTLTFTDLTAANYPGRFYRALVK